MKKTWVSGKGPEGEKTNEQRHTLDFNEPPAVVKLSLGRTINTGNYESIRVDAGVELPCTVDGIREAQKEARRIVEKALEEIIDELLGDDGD